MKPKIAPFRLKKIHTSSTLDFYTPDLSSPVKLPLFVHPVSAGFPSAAEDYIELHLSLDEHVVKHSSATFYLKAKGDSMKNAGIHNGDILVVDRSLDPKNGSIVIGSINGEFTIKRIKTIKGELYLVPENADFPSIKITVEQDFQVWGVVTYTLHKH